MVRVGARLLLFALLVSWLGPAALAVCAQPDSCCHRGSHHCSSGTAPAFRSSKVHCQSCQAVVTAHQSPRPAQSSAVVGLQGERPFVHESTPAFTAPESRQERNERGPPASA